MKLLLVTNLFPTPFDPERGIFTLQLVKRLQQFCEVTVVCPLPWFPRWKVLAPFKKYAQFSSTPEQYEIEGISVHSPKYPLIPKLSENYHSFFMAQGIKRCIQKLHKENDFDAVNSQWLYPDSVAVDKILENLPIPHIATGLGCDVNQDTYEPIKGLKILQMLENCEKVTVVSNSLKQELINHGIQGGKINVIPNGIDTSQFRVLDKSECRSNLHIETRLPVVLYVGRLSEEKNVSTLLKSTAALADKGLSICLNLVGDGPLKNELKALAQQLGIQDSVNFVGKVDHSQIGMWMGATDYFCLPSLREGCPNVILEALGSGRPVIASRVGAIPDVVSKESGILFTPENVEELSDSLKTAFETKWSAEVISGSVQKLSWENAAGSYFEVFQQATKV